jgi:hypothetical protein
MEEGISLTDRILLRLSEDLAEDRILSAIYRAFLVAQMFKDQNRSQYFLVLMKNQDLLRRIGRLDAIKKDPDAALAYYEDDRNNDPYEYDHKTEDEVAEIKSQILTFMGENAARDQLADLFGTQM